MRAKYNARLCAGFRKSAGAGTMANNEKNNAQSNRKQSEITVECLGPDSIIPDLVK